MLLRRRFLLLRRRFVVLLSRRLFLRLGRRSLLRFGRRLLLLWWRVVGLRGRLLRRRVHQLILPAASDIAPRPGTP